MKLNETAFCKVCLTDIDQGREMIIFELILTIFIDIIILKAAVAVAKNWLEL